MHGEFGSRVRVCGQQGTHPPALAGGGSAGGPQAPGPPRTDGWQGDGVPAGGGLVLPRDGDATAERI